MPEYHLLLKPFTELSWHLGPMQQHLRELHSMAIVWVASSVALSSPCTWSDARISPAAETIPLRLWTKCGGGQFVEMKELLINNIALICQLEAVQQSSTIPMVGLTRPHLRGVTSLPTSCFMVMQTSDPVTLDQLTYACLLIKGAQWHCEQGWLDYD
jgi:hypothetical protein